PSTHRACCRRAPFPCRAVVRVCNLAGAARFGDRIAPWVARSPIAQVHLIEPALVVSGVKVTVFPSMTGLPPSPFEYRIEITPFPTVTEVTYFEVIEAAAGRPAPWLSSCRWRSVRVVPAC